MALQLPIQYEQLVELVEQLSEEQQKDLIKRLLNLQAQQRPLTIEEKLKLLDAVKLHNAVNEEPSIRREDWYDDDGR
jgi:Zn-dependent M16 (insulinase) family peptidase